MLTFSSSQLISQLFLYCFYKIIYVASQSLNTQNKGFRFQTFIIIYYT